jgi:hypothetical protein
MCLTRKRDGPGVQVFGVDDCERARIRCHVRRRSGCIRKTR